MRRSALTRRAPEPVRTKYFPLKGGLNLTDAPLSLKPGTLLFSMNYEAVSTGGYRRIDGIERFDGRPSPSSQSYWILNFDAATVEITTGQVVDGLTSGASGKVLLNGILESGAYDGSGAGYLVLTQATGAFADNEALQVAATTKCVANGLDAERGASTKTLDTAYYALAQDTQRALIGKVGAADGSGAIRGVNVYNGVTYAFRDNAAVTECLMWKETVTGWVKQELGNRIEFTAGTAEFVEGETLTGGTSGATATINRVAVQSGAFASNTAAGYIIIGAVTGGPFQAETVTGGTAGSATGSGAETANTLQPGGRFEFVNFNFYANASRYRMYGVDGKSMGFEWDGSVFVPIKTGNTVDTPVHIAAKSGYLAYSFAGGSLQLSDAGLPYEWASGTEFGAGAEIVGLKIEVGDVLLVLCRSKTRMLYGNSPSSFDLKSFYDDAGGIEWTLQRMGSSKYLDDRGITNLGSVQAWGDFRDSTISQNIEKRLLSKLDKVISSVIVKQKNQYRLFFTDGTGIIMTLNGNKLSGFTEIIYENPDDGTALPVNVVVNGEDSSGREALFFGSNTGYLYQMDKGTSMDGAAVDAAILMSYWHLNSLGYEKQFKKATIEVDGGYGSVISFRPQFDYGSTLSPDGIDHVLPVSGGDGGFWDIGLWDAFDWGGEDVSQAEANIDGVGENIALAIQSSLTVANPHTLYGVTYNYLYRRLKR